MKKGKPISRESALGLCLEIPERAEKEQAELAEKEARRGARHDEQGQEQ